MPCEEGHKFIVSFCDDGEIFQKLFLFPNILPCFVHT